jgi:hypothetical protein
MVWAAADNRECRQGGKPPTVFGKVKTGVCVNLAQSDMPAEAIRPKGHAFESFFIVNTRCDCGQCSIEYDVFSDGGCKMPLASRSIVDNSVCHNGYNGSSVGLVAGKKIP